MLDSIYIGMKGLTGFSQGLKVISNNTANMNTPGFKAAALQFANLYYSNGSPDGSGFAADDRIGNGVVTAGTTLNFTQGELRPTGNDLDLAIDGTGFFVLKDTEGNVRYTRAGQFQFNGDNVLINRIDGAKVMATDASGGLAELNMSALLASASKPTSLIKFAGNLSSTATEQTIGGITVLDQLGGTHSLQAKFTRDPADTGPEANWTVTVLDGTTTISTVNMIFEGGQPTVATSKIALTYRPAGAPSMPLTLDFGSNVTSFPTGDSSTLAMSTQDGFGRGEVAVLSFDAKGNLTIGYSNGQTAKGQRLAVARFDTPEAVESAGNNQFISTDDSKWHIGHAEEGAFGSIQSGRVEISNVDLSQEFSDLVIMQRGYQASSQVISTANEMLQELFSMKSK